MFMLTYTHIILTRFNLQYDSESRIHLNSSWLDNRFELFERYCLPSVEGQSEKNFKWLILMDGNTPVVYRERMEKYSNRIHQLMVVYCPLSGNLNMWYKEVAISYGEDRDILITTRLDNDDQLGIDYVKIVQNYVNQPTSVIPSILSFAYGNQHFVRNNLFYNVRYVPNHYLSFVEYTSQAVTSLGRDHSQIRQDEITTLDVVQPMWTEVVHGGNICNGYCPAWTYYPQNWEEHKFLIGEWIRFRWYQILRHLPFVHSN